MILQVVGKLHLALLEDPDAAAIGKDVSRSWLDDAGKLHADVISIFVDELQPCPFFEPIHLVDVLRRGQVVGIPIIPFRRTGQRHVPHGFEGDQGDCVFGLIEMGAIVGRELTKLLGQRADQIAALAIGDLQVCQR